MKLFVGVISCNEFVCKRYSEARTGLVSKDFLSKSLKERASINVGVFNPNADPGKSAEAYLAHVSKVADAVILLVEENCLDKVESIRNAFFSVGLEFPAYIQNWQNYLGGTLRRLLRNFSTLFEAMSDADAEQIASLPIRNFVATELGALVRVCRHEAASPDFANELTEQLAALRNRRHPRKRSARPTLYFVDDKGKHFVYGKEVHSKLETGPPHLVACQIAGNFRFGKRISTDRHFNVSYGSGDTTTISGDFENCHGAVVSVKKTTHLNMFSNDFF